jgi:hypothetical protein
MTAESKRSMARRKKTAPVDPARVEDITAGLLAEAEKLLGITGPRLTINVDGQMYRLMSHPETQPAAAAAIFAEMIFMVRHWLGKHPEAAKEISEYPSMADDEMKALPLSIQVAIYLGLGFEIYAHKHPDSKAD